MAEIAFFHELSQTYVGKGLYSHVKKWRWLFNEIESFFSTHQCLVIHHDFVVVLCFHDHKPCQWYMEATPNIEKSGKKMACMCILMFTREKRSIAILQIWGSVLLFLIKSYSGMGERKMRFQRIVLPARRFFEFNRKTRNTSSRIRRGITKLNSLLVSERAS